MNGSGRELARRLEAVYPSADLVRFGWRCLISRSAL